MKKLFKALLLIVVILAAVVVGLRLFRPEPEPFMTEEECIQRIAGEWVDPLGDYGTHVFNADGTGSLDGIPVTWEITKLYGKGGGSDHASIHIECHPEGIDKVCATYFEYYEETDLLMLRPYTIRSEDRKEVYGDEEDLYTSAIREDTVYRYKAGDWELITLDSTNWNEYFCVSSQAVKLKSQSSDGRWAKYHNILLKPEYASRVLCAGNEDYLFECAYRYDLVPCYFEENADGSGITLTERISSCEAIGVEFCVPDGNIYDGELEEDFDPERGASLATLSTVEAGLPDGDREYVTEVENCELVYGFGNLLLAK